jgi:hypothetical protein
MIVKSLIAISLLSAACVASAGCGGEDSSPTGPSPVCSYAITPAASAYAFESGSGSVGVTTSASCSWSASSNVAWLTITGASSGSGPGSLAYAVAENAAAEPRTGTLTVAGQAHTVTQQGKPSTVCSYELAPAGAEVGVEDTRGSFAVTTPDGCAWTAGSNASWLTVTGGSPGSGSGTVSFKVDANPGFEGRLGLITVADKTFSVRQGANPPLCQYSVAPVELNPCMPARSMTTTVTAPAGCTWTVTPNASWLSIPSGSSGSGNGTITIDVSENYDAPRDGIVMVRWPTPTAGQNVRVAQAGCLYAVSQSSFTFAAGGGPGSFNVVQQSVPNTCGGATQDRCIWSAVADVPWIAVTGSMPRAGDNPVAFTVAPNTTGAARVGRITVRDRVVVVNQAQ